jgi:hypothetical protein
VRPPYVQRGCDLTYKPEKSNKHWLDHAIFWAAVIAALSGTAAAGFTGWQAAIAKDTARKDLRAWVTVKWALLCKPPTINVCNKATIEDKRQLWVEIRNSGKTPSLKTVIRHCGLGTLPVDFRKECSEASGSSHAVIGPDMTMASFSEDKRTLQSQNHELFSYGLIEYEDIYGVQHWTTFCYVSPNAATTTTSACSKGNEADN